MAKLEFHGKSGVLYVVFHKQILTQMIDIFLEKFFTKSAHVLFDLMQFCMTLEPGLLGREKESVRES